MYLIYKEGLRGPEISKSLELPLLNSVNGQTTPVIATRKLTAEEFALSLSLLEWHYPAP
jgi:hypothetical protein